MLGPGVVAYLLLRRKEAGLGGAEGDGPDRRRVDELVRRARRRHRRRHVVEHAVVLVVAEDEQRAAPQVFVGGDRVQQRNGR
jgi:hypothetical protein